VPWNVYVEGIHTTIPLHRRILADLDFRAGNFDTGFIGDSWQRRKLRHESAELAQRRLDIETMLQLPRLYPILDPACFPDGREMFAAAEELAAAGITLLQYRNKQGTARQMLDEARELRSRLAPRVKLIMNDRADLCLASAFDGLHVVRMICLPKLLRVIIDLRAGWESQPTIRGARGSR